MSLTLLGCGGGGGSEEEKPVSLAELRQRPLALTTDQVPAVTGLSIASASLAIGLGDWAVATLKEASHKLPDGTSKACTNHHNTQTSKSSTRLWEDTNRDGKLNEGDKISVVFEGDRFSAGIDQCFVPELGSYVVGRIDIRISQLQDARRGSVAGEISFPQPLIFLDEGGGAATARLAGSLRFSSNVEDFQVRMDIQPSALDDLRIPIDVPDPKTGQIILINEYIKSPSLTRIIQYDVARTTMTGSLQVQSEALKGRFDFRFGNGLSAHLLQFPHEGGAEVVGDKGKISISPGSKNAERYFAVKLDSAGDGTYEYSSTVDWQNFDVGNLWTDGSSSRPFLKDLQELGFQARVLVEGADIAWEGNKPLTVQFMQEITPGQSIEFRLRKVIDTGYWYILSVKTREVIHPFYEELRV
ncbi:MAG: hypothetical protein U5L74_14095 [Ideonella sp.]|nr:hypothetical protein [Ideonella sp.]